MLFDFKPPSSVSSVHYVDAAAVSVQPPSSSAVPVAQPRTNTLINNCIPFEATAALCANVPVVGGGGDQQRSLATEYSFSNATATTGRLITVVNNHAICSSSLAQQPANNNNAFVLPLSTLMTFQDLSSIPDQLSKLGISALPLGSIPIQQQPARFVIGGGAGLGAPVFNAPCASAPDPALNNLTASSSTAMQRLPSMAALMTNVGGSAQHQCQTSAGAITFANATGIPGDQSSSVSTTVINNNKCGSQLPHNRLTVQYQPPQPTNPSSVGSSHVPVITNPYQYLTLNSTTAQFGDTSTGTDVKDYSNFIIASQAPNLVALPSPIIVSSVSSSSNFNIPASASVFQSDSLYKTDHSALDTTLIQRDLIPGNINFLDLLVSAAHTVDYAASLSYINAPGLPLASTGYESKVESVPFSTPNLTNAQWNSINLLNHQEDSHCSSVSTLSADDACDFASILDNAVGMNASTHSRVATIAPITLTSDTYFCTAGATNDYSLAGSSSYQKAGLNDNGPSCFSHRLHSASLTSQSPVTAIGAGNSTGFSNTITPTQPVTTSEVFLNTTTSDEDLASVAKPKYVMVKRADGTYFTAKVLVTIVPSVVQTPPVSSTALPSPVGMIGGSNVPNGSHQVAIQMPGGPSVDGNYSIPASASIDLSPTTTATTADGSTASIVSPAASNNCPPVGPDSPASLRSPVTSPTRNHRFGLREPVTYRPEVFVKKTRPVQGPDRAIAEQKSEALLEYIRGVVKHTKQPGDGETEPSRLTNIISDSEAGPGSEQDEKTTRSPIYLPKPDPTNRFSPNTNDTAQSCCNEGLTLDSGQCGTFSYPSMSSACGPSTSNPSNPTSVSPRTSCVIPTVTKFMYLDTFKQSIPEVDKLDISDNSKNCHHNNVPCDKVSKIDSIIEQVIQENYLRYSGDPPPVVGDDGSQHLLQDFDTFLRLTHQPAGNGPPPLGFSMPNGSISPAVVAEGSTQNKYTNLHNCIQAPPISASLPLSDQLAASDRQLEQFKSYTQRAKRKRTTSAKRVLPNHFEHHDPFDSKDDLEFDGTIEMELSPTTKSRRLGPYPASGGFVNGNHAGFGEIPQIPGISEITESTSCTSSINFRLLQHFESSTEDVGLVDVSFEKDILEIQRKLQERIMQPKPAAAAVESKSVGSQRDALIPSIPIAGSCGSISSSCVSTSSIVTSSALTISSFNVPSCSISIAVPATTWNLMEPVKPETVKPEPIKSEPVNSELVDLLPTRVVVPPAVSIKKHPDSSSKAGSPMDSSRIDETIVAAVSSNCTLSDRNNLNNTRRSVIPDVKPVDKVDGPISCNNFTTVRLTRAKKLTRKLRENLENYQNVIGCSVSSTIAQGEPKLPYSVTIRHSLSSELEETRELTPIDGRPGIIKDDGSFTCARVRPYAGTKQFKSSRSVDCARMIPFDPKRHKRDFNWFYPFVHRCRTHQYTPRALRVTSSIARQSPGDEVAKSKYGNLLGATDLSLSLQYRLLPFREPTVRLGRSGIHGVGLFSLRPVDVGQLIVEYVGQKIRPTVADFREKLYLKKHRRLDVKYVNMFRLDDDNVIDATMHGGLARFINHSCMPNCSARVINHHGVKRIVLVASRFVEAGEEICYNYKLPIENGVTDKILCRCHTAGCRKYLN